jgi:cytidine deaminase
VIEPHKRLAEQNNGHEESNKEEEEDEDDTDAGNPRCARRATRRFVQLIFGNTFRTPYPDEYGMFLAHAAAVRSADLGRQVGAVIASSEHDTIALGTNEVPKAGGGQYWPGHPNDGRDCNKNYDVNDRRKRELCADMLLRLARKLELPDEKVKEVIEDVFSDEIPDYLKDADFMNLIAFFRAVHAETAALLNAARRGVPVKDATMFVTTFPCHECTRHIVDAGIAKVVYVEPYAKSLASDQYPESISVDDDKDPSKIPMVPYVGIAARQYMQLFEKLERKDTIGRRKKWWPNKATLRYFEPEIAYIINEQVSIKLASK